MEKLLAAVVFLCESEIDDTRLSIMICIYIYICQCCEIYTPIPLMCPLQVGHSPIYPAWRFYPKPEVGGLMWPSWELEL